MQIKQKSILLLKREYEMIQNIMLGLDQHFVYPFNLKKKKVEENHDGMRYILLSSLYLSKRNQRKSSA
jgi:hypothetical protein